jgi:hypothetical protein
MQRQEAIMCALRHVLRLRWFVLVVAVGLWSAPSPADEKPAATPAKSPTEAAADATKSAPEPHANTIAWSPRIDAIRRILDKPIDLNLHEVPLSDFRGELEKRLGIPVQVARKALDDAGIQSDVPLTYKAAGISAGSALNMILSDIGLTWTVRNDALLVTTPEDAEGVLLVRTYGVADLVAAQDAQGRPVDAFASLIETITATVHPGSWSDAGGPCSISACSANGVKALVVSHTIHGHEEIEAFLADLRALRDRPAPAVTTALRQIEALRKPVAIATPPSAAPASAPLATPEPAASLVVPAPSIWEKSLSRALDQKVTLDFQEKPFDGAMDELQKMLKIPVKISKRALDDAGIQTDAPVTLQVKDVSARAVLDTMTKGLSLTWMPYDELLWITTPEDAESQDHQVVRMYDVADLATDAIGLDNLIDLITGAVHVDSWTDVGGPSVINPYCVPGLRVLVVIQTWQIHEDLTAFLTNLRRMRHGPLPKPVGMEPPLATATPSVTKWQTRGEAGNVAGSTPPLPLGSDPKRDSFALASNQFGLDLYAKL